MKKICVTAHCKNNFVFWIDLFPTDAEEPGNTMLINCDCLYKELVRQELEERKKICSGMGVGNDLMQVYGESTYEIGRFT